MKIVTIGGGTGSFSILSELKKRKDIDPSIQISAIVAMSDSGGSSGVLMDSYGVLPAGDVRQCLVALAPASEILRDLFLYRYKDGDLEGHNFGNIFISTLENMKGSFREALRESEKILNICGSILPVSYDKHELVAEMVDGSRIVSEKNLDNADLRNIESIYSSIPLKINKKIPKAIREADIVIVNPGSFYTSIIPNFLVKDLVTELEKSSAKKIFITNIVTEKEQTDGFNVTDFLLSLKKHTGFSNFDYVFFNNNVEADKKVLERYAREGKSFVDFSRSLEHKGVVFVGGDFILENDEDKKPLFRVDAKKVIDNILKL